MLNIRVLSAVVALPILFLAVILSSDIFFVSLCLISVIGLYEYFAAVKNSTNRPMTFIGLFSGLIMLFIIYSNFAFNLLVPFITFLILILLSVPVVNKNYSFWGAGATIVGLLYIPLFFGYLYWIRVIPVKGVYLIWFVFISSWFTDTFAYFSGMLFGKTKLCPSISPKKTVEGSIGGIIGSCVGCTVYGLYINSIGITDALIISFFILGLVGSIVSQFGDLAASAIKRNVGIKDYGKIMPGHGGVLDRFDSILFVSPLIYYYVMYIIL